MGSAGLFLKLLVQNEDIVFVLFNNARNVAVNGEREISTPELRVELEKRSSSPYGYPDLLQRCSNLSRHGLLVCSKGRHGVNLLRLAPNVFRALEALDGAGGAVEGGLKE